MDINNFLDTVATFLGKTTDYFSTATGRPDILLLAANNAKLFAQRGQDFEKNRTSVTVPMFPDERGADLEDALDTLNNRSCRVNKIEAAYWHIGTTGDPLTIDCDNFSATSVDFNCAFESRPLTLISGQALADRKRKMMDLGVRCLQNGRLWAPWGFNRWDPFLYRVNNRLFLCPVFPHPVNIRLDVIKWMDDYAYEDGDFKTTCDWLLDFGKDYLLYRMMSELNVFLKEDDRLNISQSKMTEAWVNLTAWDSTLIKGDENLD